MTSRPAAVAQTLLIVMITSLAGVLSKRALTAGVPPFTFAWLQIAIGGAVLTAYTFGVRGERIPRGLGRAVWWYIVIIGVLNFAGVRVLFMAGLDRLPANTSIYLVNHVGIVTMLLSIVMLGERPSVFQAVGAVVALVGLRIFFDEVPSPTEMTGVVYACLGVLFLATTNNVARKVHLVTNHGLSNLVMSTVALWIGGIPVILWGVTTGLPPAVPGVEEWGIVVLSAVITITIGLTVWNHVLRTLRSYEASILAGTTVIFVPLFAWPLLGERLTLHEIAGILLMLVGLAMVQVRGRLSRSSRS